LAKVKSVPQLKLENVLTALVIALPTKLTRKNAENLVMFRKNKSAKKCAMLVVNRISVMIVEILGASVLKD